MPLYFTRAQLPEMPVSVIESPFLSFTLALEVDAVRYILADDELTFTLMLIASAGHSAAVINAKAIIRHRIFLIYRDMSCILLSATIIYPRPIILHFCDN